MRCLAFAGLVLFATAAWPVSGRLAGTDAAVTQSGPSCNALKTCITSTDSSSPPRLNGRGGQPPDYDFNHSADANQSGAGSTLKYIYEHQIQNKSPRNVLWAEWRDGAILFQPIPPCECAPGYRESTIEPKEKPDSEIRYGQSRQFPQSPQPLSAYVPLNQGRTTTTTLPPSLLTRLFARASDYVLDLLFTTEALPGNRFRYTIQNKSTGNGTLLFSIPAVTTRWAQFQQLAPALEGSTWQPAGQPIAADSFFVAPTSSLAVWTVAAPPGTNLREETAEVSVALNSRDRRLASGVVSVYLPIRQQ